MVSDSSQQACFKADRWNLKHERQPPERNKAQSLVDFMVSRNENGQRRSREMWRRSILIKLEKLSLTLLEDDLKSWNNVGKWHLGKFILKAFEKKLEFS